MCAGSMDREDWNQRYAGTELLWTAQPNRFLVAETEGLPPGRAVDLACGEGRNAVWLAERGWRVTGADFSDVALEKARSPAAAALAPGGTLLVVAHDTANLEHGHGGPKDPAVLYTAADAAADVAGSGLEVERAEVVERPVETPEGERIALDALFRARRPA